MSIETGLRSYLLSDAAVAALIGTRVYPMRLPQGYSLPAISYQRVSTERDHDLSYGPLGWAWSRFQFDLWAESYSEARSLAKSVRQALDGYLGSMDDTEVAGVYIEGERDLFEENTEVYRVTQDYLVPYKETA